MKGEIRWDALCCFSLTGERRPMMVMRTIISKFHLVIIKYRTERFFVRPITISRPLKRHILYV
jgi:hypothetical protein